MAQFKHSLKEDRYILKTMYKLLKIIKEAKEKDPDHSKEYLVIEKAIQKIINDIN